MKGEHELRFGEHLVKIKFNLLEENLQRDCTRGVKYGPLQ